MWVVDCFGNPFVGHDLTCCSCEDIYYIRGSLVITVNQKQHIRLRRRNTIYPVFVLIWMNNISQQIVFLCNVLSMNDPPTYDKFTCVSESIWQRSSHYCISETDIRTRIAIPLNCTFKDDDNLDRCRHKLSQEIHVLLMIVISTVLRGSETWTLTFTTEMKILAFKLKVNKKRKKLYFVMLTMSRLNRDFQWAIRDKQSLLRARFLHLIMKHAWSGNRTADQRHAKRTC